MDPRPALLAALTGFAAVHVLEAVRSPLPLPALGVNALVLIPLAFGFRAASRLESARDER